MPKLARLLNTAKDTSSSQKDGPENPVPSKALVNDFQMELKIKKNVNDLWIEFSKDGEEGIDVSPA